MENDWLWYCEFCDKWFDDYQVLSCSCQDLLCPDCEEPVRDRKYKKEDKT